MNKEEIIKDTYGKPCETDENGWTELEEVDFGRDFLGDNVEYYDFEHSNKWRPIELQGIEDNNGWTKICSDADLPKNTELGYMVSKNKEVIFSSTITSSAVVYLYNTGKITHYQPIEKPQPPIY